MADIKGVHGYINREKKKRGLKAGLFFGIIALIIIFGYIMTGTKLNWFTLIAVVLCLPGSKMLVQLITLMPYNSVAGGRADEVAGSGHALTLVYETVITSTEKIMPLEMTAVYDNTVCGYTGYDKVNTADAGKYLKTMLTQNRLADVTVKIFNNYDNFLGRVREMNDLAEMNHKDSKEKEEHIRQVLLNLSL